VAAFVDTAAIGADEARDNFGDLLGRASHGKERVVISRHRKCVAALVPIEDLELLERIEDDADLKEIRARLAKPVGKPIPLKDAAARLGVKL
jgi:prevent-host-death family protein